MRVPKEVVGEDVVLENFGNKSREDGVQGRAMFAKRLVCLKVQAMFAPGVAIGDSAKQEEQNLPVSGAQKSLVLFGVVLRVILIHRCLHILVEALHSLVVVIY